MEINKTYQLDQEKAIRALEEIADLFLKEEYQNQVTFQGRTLDEAVVAAKEQWPAHYWFDTAEPQKINQAFYALAGSQASICQQIATAAYLIHISGTYQPNPAEEAVRFRCPELIATHQALLDYQEEGFEQKYQVTIGDGHWYLRFRYTENKNLQVHLSNNWPGPLTDGFKQLYQKLFENIIDKHLQKLEKK